MESYLNKTKLDDSMHQQYVEFYKIAYQTDLVADEVTIEITEE